MVDHANSPLRQLSDQTRVDLPTLLGAAQTTSERLGRRSELLTGLEIDNDASIVFVGSWGRYEVTQSSDNDFYVLVDGKERAEVLPTVDTIVATIEAAEGTFKRPGQEATFGGKTVFLDELLSKIGLDRDSNTNLTQRMLLVLESTSVRNPDVHQRARSAVIAGYLRDPIRDFRPPRLFLNDVVRYWRTMCVDFAGKMRDRDNQGWGLRNAKLRTTRKMLFAAGLLPLLRCGELRAEQMEPFLNHQFNLPATDRIADAFLHWRAFEAAATVYKAYDNWLSLLDQTTYREALDDIDSREKADASVEFSTAARLGADIDVGLLDLLFSPPVFRWTREFAIV